MRSFVKSMTVVAAVGVFLLSVVSSEAQEAVTIQQSPELKELGRFVGSWKWNVLCKPAEWTPVEKAITFDHETEWILGGRMIQHKWVWSPGGDKIHCTSLMGYDAEKQQYTEWYFDSNGEVPRGENKRTWDEATKTFTSKQRSPHGTTTTQTQRFIDDDTMEWTMVIKDAAGKLLSDMEGTTKRK